MFETNFWRRWFLVERLGDLVVFFEALKDGWYVVDTIPERVAKEWVLAVSPEVQMGQYEFGSIKESPCPVSALWFDGSGVIVSSKESFPLAIVRMGEVYMLMKKKISLSDS
jgi:hypothetical protein